MNVLTQVQTYILYWQPILRLKDWNFVIKNIHSDPTVFDMFARINSNRNNQVATLELLDPEKIPEEWIGCRDLEVTVVHEMLHTRLAHVHTGKSTHHEEFAIETLSKALVSLKRGVTPEELV